MLQNFRFLKMFRTYVTSSMLLIAATVLALVIANTSMSATYFEFWNQTVSLSVGDFNLFSHGGHTMTILDLINDFFMAIFFLSVGLEIKREILVGELSSPRNAMLPLIGACGGMLIPVLVFCIPATIKSSVLKSVEQIRECVASFPQQTITGKHSNARILTHRQVDMLKQIETASDHVISPLQDMEDNLHTPVSFMIIPVFAFANAGISFQGMGFDNLFSGVGLAVMLGLVLGKFLGVFSFSWLAIRTKLVRLPKGSSWKAFASVCMLSGIGFTVALFIAGLAYDPRQHALLLADAKLGILAGSILSALISVVMLHLFLPKDTE